MKNSSKLELDLPSIDVLDGINYCPNALYSEAVKATNDFAVKGLKFEEIIGTLLFARDEIRSNNDD